MGLTEQHTDPWMTRAIELGASQRATSPPNPWVGCVIVAADGRVFEGATQAVGGKHAEIMALDAAGEAANGATVYVTLEPCCHVGRTPPCTDALIRAGVARVVVGIQDPDKRVAGAGMRALEAAGITVTSTPAPIQRAIAQSLEPYLHHRRTGRPFVVCKLAASLDGATAALDGSSQWITGPVARTDAHRLRAESDAIIVGAGTVRFDNPSLTVRHVEAPRGDPTRIVLGTIPPGAKILPAQEHHGSLQVLLDELGKQNMLQVLVEGGASVAHAFHHEGLVNRYVLYVAPVFFGGDDARGLFAGRGAQTIRDVWRGSIESVTVLGTDVRIDVVPGQLA